MSDVDYKKHLCENILKNWVIHGPDEKNGGFFGRLEADWTPQKQAPKSLILITRILWSFSSAYMISPKEEYKKCAEIAYDFLVKNFEDSKCGGFFYKVQFDGTPLDKRKHVYQHSFVIYSLSEFARAFESKEALKKAVAVFSLLEQKAHDKKDLGYNESFSQSWEEIDQHEDMGVSGKRKSMNTHIHMLEALTNLYKAQSSLEVENRLKELLHVSENFIYNKERKSLDLFFEKNWKALPSETSFGHDIEFSWLFEETAELLGYKNNISLPLAENTLKGLSQKHGLFYHGDSFAKKVTDERRVWWVQAEGLVGFFNAYQMTKDEKFLEAFKAIENWTFKYMIDQKNGDWHEEASEEKGHGPKGYFWKDPYHQSRAVMEIFKRQKKVKGELL